MDRVPDKSVESALYSSIDLNFEGNFQTNTTLLTGANRNYRRSLEDPAGF